MQTGPSPRNSPVASPRLLTRDPANLSVRDGRWRQRQEVTRGWNVVKAEHPNHNRIDGRSAGDPEPHALYGYGEVTYAHGQYPYYHGVGTSSVHEEQVGANPFLPALPYGPFASAGRATSAPDPRLAYPSSLPQQSHQASIKHHALNRLSRPNEPSPAYHDAATRGWSPRAGPCADAYSRPDWRNSDGFKRSLPPSQFEREQAAQAAQAAASCKNDERQGASAQNDASVRREPSGHGAVHVKQAGGEALGRSRQPDGVQHGDDRQRTKAGAVRPRLVLIPQAPSRSGVSPTPDASAPVAPQALSAIPSGLSPVNPLKPINSLDPVPIMDPAETLVSDLRKFSDALRAAFSRATPPSPPLLPCVDDVGIEQQTRPKAIPCQSPAPTDLKVNAPNTLRMTKPKSEPFASESAKHPFAERVMTDTRVINSRFTVARNTNICCWLPPPEQMTSEKEGNIEENTVNQAMAKPLAWLSAITLEHIHPEIEVNVDSKMTAPGRRDLDQMQYIIQQDLATKSEDEHAVVVDRSPQLPKPASIDAGIEQEELQAKERKLMQDQQVLEKIIEEYKEREGECGHQLAACAQEVQMMHGMLKALAEENDALRGEVETFKAMIAKMKAMMAATAATARDIAAAASEALMFAADDHVAQKEAGESALNSAPSFSTMEGRGAQRSAGTQTQGVGGDKRERQQQALAVGVEARIHTEDANKKSNMVIAALQKEVEELRKPDREIALENAVPCSDPEKQKGRDRDNLCQLQREVADLKLERGILELELEELKFDARNQRFLASQSPCKEERSRDALGTPLPAGARTLSPGNKGERAGAAALEIDDGSAGRGAVALKGDELVMPGSPTDAVAHAFYSDAELVQLLDEDRLGMAQQAGLLSESSSSSFVDHEGLTQQAEGFHVTSCRYLL